MEIKHKECFIPNTIAAWDLQPVAKYARHACEFVNLYSKDRGANRFPALIRVFDLLADWPEVQRRHATIPVAQPLRDWIARETTLSGPALKTEAERTGDPILTQTVRWTDAVNRAVAEIVHGVPPFPLVRESLAAVSEWADVLVCSATPHEALVREWGEHGLDLYVSLIAGQEMGGKTQQIHDVFSGRYGKENVIMLGDALGDLKAARDNGVAFFPIDPGQEDGSWELFFREGAERFREGSYAGHYESELVARFDALLPSVPWWRSDVVVPSSSTHAQGRG